MAPTGCQRTVTLYVPDSPPGPKLATMSRAFPAVALSEQVAVLPVSRTSEHRIVQPGPLGTPAALKVLHVFPLTTKMSRSFVANVQATVAVTVPEAGEAKSNVLKKPASKPTNVPVKMVVGPGVGVGCGVGCVPLSLPPPQPVATRAVVARRNVAIRPYP
jgi:hypothetical protein